MRFGAPIDFVVLVVYFVAILGFGSLFGRHTKTTRDFFFAGQRFSWWLVGLSLVATLVGSYSFIKYTAVGAKHGLSSSYAYLNDWIWMPLFMFGWLPIVYFARIKSVPEYFERRFDRRTRVAATVLLLVYMLGYLGINFYTLGVALHRVLGWEVFPTAAVIAVVTGVYVTAGGQTAVIMTDLLQGFLLLFVGLAVFLIGWHALGDGDVALGAQKFWQGLSPEQRRALPPFNDPPGFNFVGIFWQDGFANTVFFYFLNQGLLMRFLSVRSVREGRKAALFMLLGLVPLAALAVSSAGWLTPALVKAGIIDADTSAKDIFVVVAHALTEPGVFGLILAALAAALMSSADSLINAIAAVFVNDVYQPFVRREAADAHYLRVARIVSVVTAALGLALVPLFMSFSSIYLAHGAFTAACTPGLVVALLLGLLWRGFTPQAALWTLIGGALATAASFAWPELVSPFAHGTAAEGSGLKVYSYIRALYALSAAAVIGIVAGLLTRSPPPPAPLALGGLDEARRAYKGGAEPREVSSPPIVVAVASVSGPGDPDDAEPEVSLSAADRVRLGAQRGDLVFVSHPAWWHGGLRGQHARLGPDTDRAGASLSESVLRRLKVAPGGEIRVELLL